VRQQWGVGSPQLGEGDESAIPAKVARTITTAAGTATSLNRREQLL